MYRIRKISPPTKRETIVIRSLILFGALWIAFFIYWFIDPYHIGHPVLFWMLTGALAFKLFRALHEWYHYFDISVPKKPVLKSDFTVDVFTTACPGEPIKMIVGTLEAIQKMTYPHKAYLCDEGDDPELKAACQRLGVVHVTRKVKIDAKAGNINNALRQSTGDICLILDPDHIPHPEFLDRVLPYFEDQETGFVQVVQAYYNQSESIIAYAAAEQTYHFYGPMMMGMNSYGTAQAIGANCIFRRKALESIGGHAAGLSEDMHTAMRLHGKGWKSVYVPEPLSKGLIPNTLSAYYKQQLKWARGTFDLLFYKYYKHFKGYTWRQRFHYLTVPLYYLFGVVNFIDILIPVLALIFAIFPWFINFYDFILLYLPIWVISIVIRQYMQKWLIEEHEKGFHITGGLLRCGTWWIYFLGFVYTILKKKVPYLPTPKDDKPKNNWILSIPNILAVLISGVAIIYNYYWYGRSVFYHPFNLITVAFAMTNMVVLGTVSLFSQEKFIENCRVFFRKWFNFVNFEFIPRYYYSSQDRVLGLITKYPLHLGLVVLVFTGSALLYMKSDIFTVQTRKPIEIRNQGLFYTGIHIPNPLLDSVVTPGKFNAFEVAIGLPLNKVSVKLPFDPQNNIFPKDLFSEYNRKGVSPIIVWEPGDLPFATNFLERITDGEFDPYISAFCHQIKALGFPVFIRFAPEADDLKKNWGLNVDDDDQANGKKFVAAWKRVINKFKEQKVNNVKWVWSPGSYYSMNEFYPGNEYVDFIGISVLNYGRAAKNGSWHSFAALYEPFRHEIAKTKKVSMMYKPVIITEFGATSYGGRQDVWMEEALYQIMEYYPEIKGIVFYIVKDEKSWITKWRPEVEYDFVDFSFSDSVEVVSKLRHYMNRPPFKNTKTIN
jgi:cellulose synthase (UDP-forming)